MQPYRKFARWMMRSEDIFIEYQSVLDLGLRFEAEDFGKHSRER
jgi:hypothetical protein